MGCLSKTTLVGVGDMRANQLGVVSRKGIRATNRGIEASVVERHHFLGVQILYIRLDKNVNSEKSQKQILDNKVSRGRDPEI